MLPDARNRIRGPAGIRQKLGQGLHRNQTPAAMGIKRSSSQYRKRRVCFSSAIGNNMALLSSILRKDPRLQACLQHDTSHLTEGTTGPHVNRVQTALFVLDGLRVDHEEERSQRYGKSTASAVLKFKTRRHIINHRYQSRPDNIVGKMTIAALDVELWRKEAQPQSNGSCLCGNDSTLAALGGRNQASSSAVSSLITAKFASATTPSAGNAAGLSPAATAKLRAPAGVIFVKRARGKFAAMIHFRKNPSLPINPVILSDFDALWRNFGMPVFPTFNPLTEGHVNTLDEYLSVIDSVLAGVEANLGRAQSLFRDVPAVWYPTAHAFTLAIKRDEKDPPENSTWPDGIYFNPRYLKDESGVAVGPLTQTLVPVHECGHMVQNQNIGDSTAAQTLSSAHGYSNFISFCAIGSEDFPDSA